MFRRSADSTRTPEEWVDALLSDGWKAWASGRSIRQGSVGVELGDEDGWTRVMDTLPPPD
jgi:hypothetical protein